jgi:hypothetical protein
VGILPMSVFRRRASTTRRVLSVLIAASTAGLAFHPSSARLAPAPRPAGEDPYPRMPARNDPKFIGQSWRRGPMVEGERLDYLVRAPKGDTTGMALIVVGAAGDSALTAHEELYRKAIVVYIGPSAAADTTAAHNNWLLDKMSAGEGPECSPACPAWMFLPAAAIRDVLNDVATHLRFAHDRVQMLATNDSRYGVYRALDPILQPYFAGVAHGIYAEWQQATCPNAPPPSSSPPRIFFSWGGCDESFCPTMECMSSLRGKGYEIEAASGGDASPTACSCPAVDRPHLLPAGDRVQAATYDWLLSAARPRKADEHDAPARRK